MEFILFQFYALVYVLQFSQLRMRIKIHFHQILVYGLINTRYLMGSPSPYDRSPIYNANLIAEHYRLLIGPRRSIQIHFRSNDVTVEARAREFSGAEIVLRDHFIIAQETR